MSFPLHWGFIKVSWGCSQPLLPLCHCSDDILTRGPGPVSHMPTPILSLSSRTFLLTVSNVPSMHQPKPPLRSSERHVYLSFSFFSKRKLKLRGDEYLAQGHSSHVVEPEFNLHDLSLIQSPGHILSSSVPSTVSVASV